MNGKQEREDINKMNIETDKKKKRIAILGSTGSIGTQALQVIEEHPELYEPYALTANNRVDLLIARLRNSSRR